MKISNRLKVIGDLVPDNSFILDVGCDHALLDIYVVLKNNGVCAIASDINDGPLESASLNVSKYNLNDKIKLVKADGLNSFEPCVDTIVMSGLGSNTIIDIIKKDIDKIKNVKRLIISSNNDYYYLRYNMSKLGFKINNEIMVIDNDKFYPVIEFVFGEANYNYYEFLYGPILIKDRSDSFLRFLNFRKSKLISILNSLDEKYYKKRNELSSEINFIDKLL